MLLEFNLNDTTKELHEAGSAIWHILEKWGFDAQERTDVLGFTFTDDFPTESLTEDHTRALTYALSIQNLLIIYKADPEILTTPLGIYPFLGRDLKDMMIAGGNDWGLVATYRFIKWLYGTGEWPFEDRLRPR